MASAHQEPTFQEIACHLANTLSASSDDAMYAIILPYVLLPRIARLCISLYAMAISMSHTFTILRLLFSLL